MLDNLFFEIINFLREFPNLLITIINIIISGLITVYLKRVYGYVGLCCYMIFLTIIGNIQVLYASYYEIINMPALLGTVSLSTSFLVNDFINEFYGSEKAHKAIYLSFLVQIIFLVNIILTMGHKPLISNSFSLSQELIDKNISSISQVFLPIPRILVASYVAYLASQLVEVWLYKVMKRIKNINNFISHNVSLFLSSIVIDTFVFTIVAFVILSNDPMNFVDLSNVCLSAVVIRIFCNLINSIFMKVERNLTEL